MKYEPGYIKIDIIYQDKPKRIVQAKYWSELNRCWRRVFHTWEIPDFEWLTWPKDIRIKVMRNLVDNPANVTMSNYQEYM